VVGPIEWLDPFTWPGQARSTQCWTNGWCKAAAIQCPPPILVARQRTGRAGRTDQGGVTEEEEEQTLSGPEALGLRGTTMALGTAVETGAKS
jgi:hypothetical protein